MHAMPLHYVILLLCHQFYLFYLSQIPKQIGIHKPGVLIYSTPYALEIIVTCSHSSHSMHLSHSYLPIDYKT